MMIGLVEKLEPATLLRIRNAGFMLFLIPPGLLVAAYLLGEHYQQQDVWSFFAFYFVYILIPILDYIIGKDTTNPTPEESKRLEKSLYFPILTLLCVPIQIACIFFAADYVIASYSAGTLSWIGVAGWVLSTGIVSSVLAITVGHELVHKNSTLEQWGGGLLYASVCYGGFKVEHVRGHHVNVSTPEDASSARFNENTYAFVLRAMAKNTRNAFRLEAKRLAKKKLPAFHWRNELIWWYTVTLLLATLATALFGLFGLIFFLAQGFIAISHLELINFVEHYGLHRRKLPNGKYERTTRKHSWNSSYLLTNLFLFQLQRHSDHHENPKRRYQILRHFDESPQLPGGYATMVLLALCPPLWKKVINPIVTQYYEGEEGQLAY